MIEQKYFLDVEPILQSYGSPTLGESISTPAPSLYQAPKEEISGKIYINHILMSSKNLCILLKVHVSQISNVVKSSF